MEIEEVFKYIKISAVAKRMGKSRQWLSQRLNEYHDKKEKNPRTLSPEDRELLRKTINDIALDIIANAQTLKAKLNEGSGNQ